MPTCVESSQFSSTPLLALASTTPPSSALLALAIPEILLVILSNFSSSSSSSDPLNSHSLALCSLVSSFWKETAQKELYGSLSICWRLSKVDRFTRSLEANPALYERVHSCKIIELTHAELRAEVGENEDWGKYLKAEGYEWDEPDWTEADRECMLDYTSEVRRVREWDLARAHADHGWLEGVGLRSSYLALVEFLGRLVNLRTLDLKFSGEGFFDSDTSNRFSSLERLAYLTMTCKNDDFELQILQSAANLDSLTLKEHAAGIALAPLPRLRHLFMDFFASNISTEHSFRLGHPNTSLETLFICPERRPPFEHDGSPLPLLSHLHFQAYDDYEAPYPDVGLALLPVSPQLTYLSITCRELPSGSQLLQQIVPVLSPNIRRIVITIEYSWKKAWLPGVVSRFVRAVMEQDSLMSVEIILPEVGSFDFQGLVLEARRYGVDLRMVTGYRPTTSSAEEELERMLKDWRASKVGLRV